MLGILLHLLNKFGFLCWQKGIVIIDEVGHQGSFGSKKSSSEDDKDESASRSGNVDFGGSGEK
ncbi:WSSV029 [White spot syndrome virus]|uniref:WSSV029 n=1 Tax=White spot syndrome virus TaxID=342409 RepID=A0A2I6SBG2_9VIRU|nr:WSSV029 [White spot syndrome virus]